MMMSPRSGWWSSWTITQSPWSTVGAIDPLVIFTGEKPAARTATPARAATAMTIAIRRNARR